MKHTKRRLWDLEVVVGVLFLGFQLPSNETVFVYCDRNVDMCFVAQNTLCVAITHSAFSKNASITTWRQLKTLLITQPNELNRSNLIGLITSQR